MKIGLIITAAGSGSRFGSDGLKQFELIDGQPMIVASCKAFFTTNSIDQCVITIPDGTESEFESILGGLEWPFEYQLVIGGKTRQESVFLGFQALCDVDVVLIHDAARPFVGSDLIDRVCGGLDSFEAVVPGVDVVDTVKRVEGNLVVETMDRSSLVAVQTPQGFSYKSLSRAYELGLHERQCVTDEASMMDELDDIQVCVVPGDLDNIKITYSSDI